MFDFSADEFLFLIVAASAAVWGLFRWWQIILTPPPLRDDLRGSVRAQLAVLPLLCLGFVATVIWNWADPAAVAGHIDYVILFLAGAGAWFWLTVLATSVLGIHFRHDVAVGGNRAAAVSVAGAAIATTLIYTGGNIGAGPTIWTTIIPAAMGTLALGVFWLAIEAAAAVSDAITIDRDRASGFRIAGWAVASAIILGRAVAGDWTGWDSTFDDIVRLGWPSAVLTVAVITIQRTSQPTPERPDPAERAGLAAAALMVLAAIAYVISLPPPDIGEHVLTYEESMNSR